MSSFQVLGESSKNHPDDSENLEKSGIIPFMTDEFGYNPGEFLEIYLASTSSKVDRLFQQPQRKAKWFSIHDFAIDCLFEGKGVGINMIRLMLKKLLKAAGLPEDYSNHCVRSTSISGLKKVGIDDRAIMNASGSYSNIIDFYYILI